MKIEFKDVAHLYKGCICTRLDEDGKTVVFRLTIYNLNYHKQSLDELKPILRLLKSLTDEEIAECREASKVNGHGCVKDALRTAYLLKQGFDLFNLIESGQAIDKTTLKATA